MSVEVLNSAIMQLRGKAQEIYGGRKGRTSSGRKGRTSSGRKGCICGGIP